MTERGDTRVSRRLSWLLRHGAGEVGLAMDGAGWAAVGDVLALADLDRAQLVRAVARNDKGRLQLEGERIRACQGHSAENMPVTVEALEASWERVEPGGPLWHGTSLGVLASIAASGLHAGRRTHVHLAASKDSSVGKRTGVEVVLCVSPERLRATGYQVFRAPNGVLLVVHVPAVAIVEVVPERAPVAAVRWACEAAGFPCRA